MNLGYLTYASYLVATAGFIFSIKWMSSPRTARRGVVVGATAMALAVIGTLLLPEIVSFEWIAVGIVIGTLIGTPLAVFMPMTAVPQRTALSHAFGSLAVMLVGIAKWYQHSPTGFTKGAILFEVLLGGLTFTASLMAFGKLQDLISGRPITFRGQNVINIGVLIGAVTLGIVHFVGEPGAMAFPIYTALALLFGVFLILPIGGADMPTVLALLNSYAGLSASAMGFALNNKLLIVAGALDGSSGFILAVIMCKAMNRSFANVLFGAFGSTTTATAGAKEERPVRSTGPEEAAQLLENAQSVVIVPGYGMAVSQAQHKAKELYETLSRKGVSVRFAIHPVAGRMPGHMNVLLAEADIPYDRLIEMEDINPEFSQVDVALVIGANDVTNPAAKTDKASPIYGMPVLEVVNARTVMVIKRGMSSGFAGVENELYFMDKTLMLFGDAKDFLGKVIKEFSHA
jgi:NAD(P) transhydrogenase subunit beta